MFRNLLSLVYRQTKGRPPRRRRLGVETLEGRLAPATLLPGFTETLEISGLASATAMEISPDGKLFVLEQGGTAEVWEDGAQVRSNFFADTPLTVSAVGERGLLGIAFDPDYASNRFVYVYYTATTPTIHNRVSRFTANANGDLALAGSESALLDLETLSATNHNGGAIHFGADGKLYIAVGENAVPSNSQSLSNRLGKILRINADGTIPTDNPTSFEGVTGTTTGVNQAIWAIGLRNPYTSAFQPGTGQFFINDVGSGGPGRQEEINEGGAGRNYGWPTVEGIVGNPNFTDPLFAYGASTPGFAGNCAITGGIFYNPVTDQFSTSPNIASPNHYLGDYFFSDFCGGFIKRFDPALGTVEEFATDVSFPVDLRVDTDGSLLYLARGSGQVWRVERPADPPLRAVIDDGDAGYATPSGSWTRTSFGAFDGDVSYNAAPGGEVERATWTFDLAALGLPATGTYRVSATWPAQGNLADNAPYRVYDGTTSGTLRGSVEINQIPGPDDFTADGATWEELGGPYSITSGLVTVELHTDTAHNFVFADAIRIELVAAPIIDDGDGAFATPSGSWVRTPFDAFDGDISYNAAPGGEVETATWTFDLAAMGLPTEGRYRVAATWRAQGNLATNAPYRIYDGTTAGTLLGSVEINQVASPDDFIADGATWEGLGGPYAITSGLLTVELTTDTANNFVFADAIRIDRVPLPIIDDGDAAFATPSGSWVRTSFPAFDGDISYNAAPGGEEETATWTFDLAALGFSGQGYFRVSATWQAQGNLATNAPYRIYDGTTTGSVVGSVSINQVPGPNDFVVDGATWEMLGGPYVITSGLVTVELRTDTANNFVFADAVRIDRVPPPIIDDGDAGFATPSGSWIQAGSSSFGGDISYNAAPGGAIETATWTFDLVTLGLPTNGTYRVSATWQAQGNLATNAPYRIYDGTTGGTLRGSVTINQVPGPDDFTADGATWEDLGGPYLVTSGLLTVELSSELANNFVFADAIRIELIPHG